MAAGHLRKLIVEVVDARSLLPKDKHGTSSPYAAVSYSGQRKRTATAVRDLNPTWNEVLEFNVGPPSSVFGDVLELDVIHDRSYGPTLRSNFMGRIRLSSMQFVKKGEEALIYFHLEKKSLFSWVQGEIGLRIYYSDGIAPPPSTPLPPVEEGGAVNSVEDSLPAIRSEAEQNQSPALKHQDGGEPIGKSPTSNGREASAAEIPASDATAASVAETPAVDETAAAEIPASNGREASAAETPAGDGIAASVAETPAGDGNAASVAETPAGDGTAASVAETPAGDGTAALAAETPAGDGTAASAAESPAVESTTPVEAAASAAETPPFESHPPPPVKSPGVDQIQTIPPAYAPKPIKRPAAVSSYTLESEESQTIERSTFDLVEKMYYLFVRVVKARALATSNRPIVKIEAFGERITSEPAKKSHVFEWDQTFAFSRKAADSASIMEVSVWDTKNGVVSSASDVDKGNFLGALCFEVSDILLRDQPDIPLAPQWYRLETERNDVAFGGYLMLATWIGTQADDAFNEAVKTDAAGKFNSRAKIYQSPKLWYLRATVIEAQDVVPITAVKEASFQVRAQLGFQVSVTRPAVTQNGAPSWNEDLLFVAAEPMTDHLVFTLESRRSSKYPAAVGVVRIPLTEIERRVDDRIVTARWCTLAGLVEEKESPYKGRIHVRLCFDGGYHVMDEAAHVSSDYRPTARQLWKPSVGLIEIGVIGCKNLVPMKSTAAGKGSTDAYCVAKYGSKWVRTRTVCNSFDPKWNEQYTWQVYDPCTVLTIGVFDSTEEPKTDGSTEPAGPDSLVGKVRIRISTLKTGKVYRNLYPLLLLSAAGSKKMGELEIAVRFVRTAPPFDFIHVYSQPLLPLMHHVKPLGIRQQEQLRIAAVETVVGNLSRSEPPLRREIILFMLDAESHGFSMRKVRANWYRIINVATTVIAAVKWVDDTRSWRNPTSTILVHALLVILIWFPDLIIPTVSFYAFVTSAWNYKFRSQGLLPHFDSKLSMVDTVEMDELDEEFDGMPSTRSPEVVRMRYDKLRAIGARVQHLLGDLATQVERMQALVTWQDPRATGIFTAICFAVAVVLYVVPLRMVAVACGFYYLRHPVFRVRLPSSTVNFFKRLPCLSDRLM
ncbi:protein QUIRKY isoform X2 [Cucurbita moschata]|uniref:Protein QUIRKY isoform X2 n=1 Tax=Cucurbita moschata TaxID=3662 RepID=A0A6J1EB69_CUCMO|nr:protein QUIRKY isoform X2 [Cucurbita moschata]